MYFQATPRKHPGYPLARLIDATVDDHRTVHQFSDAELTAILRRRVGVVPLESEEERPAGGALN